jgi:hypothetical protein
MRPRDGQPTRWQEEYRQDDGRCLCDKWGCRIAQREVAANCLGTIQKELHGWKTESILRGDDVRLRWEIERWEAHERLAESTQWLSARCEDAHSGSGLRNPLRQVSGCIDQMLAVVEDDEQLLILKKIDELL